MTNFATAAGRGEEVSPTLSPRGPACCPNCGHSFRDDVILVDDGFVIDPFRRVVMWQGEAVRLAPMEFDILYLIVKARGAPVSGDNLMAQIGRDSFGQTAAVHICRLRQKLPGAPIVTVWARGFAWRPTERENH